MNDASEMQKKEQTEEKSVVIAPSGKIAITTHDKQNVIVCHSVKSSKIMFPHKDEPEYILLGIDKVTFWVFIVKYKCRKLQTKNVGRCNYIL